MPVGRRLAVKDDRWIEIEDDFNAAAQHFARAVELFRRGGFEAAGIDGYAAGMAFMHAMLAGDSLLPQYADTSVAAAENLSRSIGSELRAFQDTVDRQE